MQFGETDIYQQWYHIVICHCTVYDMNDVIAVDNFDGTPPHHKSRQMAFNILTSVCKLTSTGEMVASETILPLGDIQTLMVNSMAVHIPHLGRKTMYLAWLAYGQNFNQRFREKHNSLPR